jgi:hypothetical protein
LLFGSVWSVRRGTAAPFSVKVQQNGCFIKERNIALRSRPSDA